MSPRTHTPDVFVGVPLLVLEAEGANRVAVVELARVRQHQLCVYVCVRVSVSAGQ
jgi:hypothetical protein